MTVLVLTGPPGSGKSTVGPLVAAAFDPAVVLPQDSFWPYITRGWIEPWLPEAQHQNEVVTRAVAASVVAFSEGGYTVVLEGVVFPWALDVLATACLLAGVPLHYAVLRPPLATCLERAAGRGPDELRDPGPITQLHGQFGDLGEHEANVVDGGDTPEQVAAAVLAAFRSGRLVEVEIVGGMEQRPVVLAEPDPGWPARFEVERRRILAALPGVRVEHVGSTSVAGLPAKPIIDIQVSVPDVADEASYVPALVAAGYELRTRERGHRMVRTPEQDVHVHVCSAGSDWERRHLAFRDRLRTSDEDRDRYAEVKRSLAGRAWESMNHYAQAKSAVIAEIMERA